MRHDRDPGRDRLHAFGLLPAVRQRRDRIAEAVGQHVPDPSRAIALGRVAGRTYVVALRDADGAWQEAATEFDRELAQLDRQVGTTRTGCGCLLLVAGFAVLIAGLEWRLFDDWLGRDLGAWRHWWLYGLAFAAVLALWFVFDYLLQWRRYLRVRPQLVEVMAAHRAAPAEVLARLSATADSRQYTLPRFFVHDPEFRDLADAWHAPR